jgi:hypothetical protein
LKSSQASKPDSIGQENKLTTDERIDRLTGIVETLTGTVGSLATTVLAHDKQLGVLIKLSERHEQAIANLERQWQAYLTRIAPV